MSDVDSQTKNSNEEPQVVNAEPVKAGTTSGIDNKVLILLAHVLGIILSFIAPLIVYLISEDTLVKNHARSALNFQISLAIYWLIYLVVSGFITVITFGLAVIITGPIGLAMTVFSIVVPILATLKAKDNVNEIYSYPLSYTFIKSK